MSEPTKHLSRERIYREDIEISSLFSIEYIVFLYYKKPFVKINVGTHLLIYFYFGLLIAATLKLYDNLNYKKVNFVLTKCPTC